MSSFNNRLELLQAYATEQFSSNDNKVQALINTVEWVMKFAEGLPTTSEQIDQIVVDMKRLFIGDGLSRNEGDFFIGHSIMIGTGGFQEELQDSGNQIQHAVAGLCGSLYSPAFGFVGGFSELVTAAMRDEPVNQPDIELYSRMHSFASEVHIFGVEDLIDGLIREIGDETVVHPDFTSSSTSGTTVTLESFSPEPEPKLKIEASTTAEGNTLFFRVYIDGEAVQHDISFRAITFQGTTSEFSPNGASPDYDGINATYVIPAGQTEVFVPVETEDDDLPEFMEVVELIVTETQGAENPVLVGLGTILDDDVAGFSFGAANFTTDLSGVLATASYTISHNGDDDETGVRVNAYIDSNGNGIWDSGDAHVGYESASTLRVGENDSEVIDLDGLRAYLGEQTLFLTVYSDAVDEHVVYEEQVTVEAVNVNFTLDNFEWSPDGAETRVEYDISHDFDGDIGGVRVQWYADANGNGVWDDGDDYLGYESAGTLRDGEVDGEYEVIEDLEDYEGQGDVLIFTTLEADGIERHVHRTDTIDMGGSADGPMINMYIDNDTIEFSGDAGMTNDGVLLINGAAGGEVRVDFVVGNDGSESTAGYSERTHIVYSLDAEYGNSDDIVFDYDTHGTLYVGERDSEYERFDVEDIPAQLGHFFLVTNMNGDIPDADMSDNVSDPYAFIML